MIICFWSQHHLFVPQAWRERFLCEQAKKNWFRGGSSFLLRYKHLCDGNGNGSDDGSSNGDGSASADGTRILSRPCRQVHPPPLLLNSATSGETLQIDLLIDVPKMHAHQTFTNHFQGGGYDTAAIHSPLHHCNHHHQHHDNDICQGISGNHLLISWYISGGTWHSNSRALSLLPGPTYLTLLHQTTTNQVRKLYPARRKYLARKNICQKMYLARKNNWGKKQYMAIFGNNI